MAAAWNDLSRDALLAARELLQHNRLRSSLSRAYYAAYSAVAQQMADHRIAFPRGWNNPSHDQLVRWLANSRNLSLTSRRRLTRAVGLLRNSRENADYRPDVSFTRADVIRLLKEAVFILKFFEVSYENDD